MYAVPITGQLLYVEEGEIIVYSKGLFIWYRNDSESIFIYFSVFVYLNLYQKKTYRSCTSRVHPGFHSQWNCRSGMKFIIVSCKLKTNFVPDLESQIM